MPGGRDRRLSAAARCRLPRLTNWQHCTLATFEGGSVKVLATGGQTLQEETLLEPTAPLEMAAELPSDVSRWTNEDCAAFVADVVGLPQYAVRAVYAVAPFSPYSDPIAIYRTKIC